MIDADDLFEVLGLPTGDPPELDAVDAARLAELEHALYDAVQAGVVQPGRRHDPDGRGFAACYRAEDIWTMVRRLRRPMA